MLVLLQVVVVIDVDIAGIDEEVEMTQTPKNPSIDTLGTYTVTEPIQKLNPKDDVSYEVPPGQYPVMGLLSDDGTKVQQVGVILSAADPRHGSLIDIIDLIRPTDVPAMIQRREMTLATKADKTLKFPLEMFIKNDQTKQQTPKNQKTQSITQAPVPEQRLLKGRSQ